MSAPSEWVWPRSHALRGWVCRDFMSGIFHREIGSPEAAMKTSVAIIGAGPTAGYLLAKNEFETVVLEADPIYVGGISRTVRYRGFHFDIGGHRFFSKSKAVEDLWQEILPDDMLERPRSSRIFYDRKFFAYPLRPFEALFKLGLLRSAACLLSWLKARLFPVPNPRNFE